MTKKTIILTGGGTAGHVTPNIALIKQLLRLGWHVSYIGSEEGVEKDMIQPLGIPYKGIKSGKLRRYFSWQNFIDPFKILYGVLQSFLHIRKHKPSVLFSKGGFVSFPVVVGARLNRVPVVVHESDMTPGLANKLSFPFAKTICINFEGAKSNFSNQAKLKITGTPLREELLEGNKEKGLAICGFHPDKPTLLFVGGSQGARVINQTVRAALPELLVTYQIIHICGKGNIEPTLNQQGYCQFEFVQEDLAHLFALGEVVISRSGANALYEILALAKPHVLIPLSMKASRGDQIHNAKYFEKQGVSEVINEQDLKPERLLQAINKVYQDRDAKVRKIKSLGVASGTENILKILLKP